MLTRKEKKKEKAMEKYLAVAAELDLLTVQMLKENAATLEKIRKVRK